MSRAFPSCRVPIRDLEALTQLDPDRIYVENVRGVLRISHREAVKICEVAVRQGLFEEQIAVLCPDGTVAVSAGKDVHIPSMVQCWVEIDGHKEAVDLPTDDLERLVFYRLTADE